MHAYCAASGLSYSSLEPHDFSFNSSSGMCPRCHGMGRIEEFNPDQIIDPDLSIAEDCCSVASSYQTVRIREYLRQSGRAICDFQRQHALEEALARAGAKQIFLHGTEKKWDADALCPSGDRRHSGPTTCAGRGVVAAGPLPAIAEAKSEALPEERCSPLMSVQQVCRECHGERLKPYAAATLAEWEADQPP